MICLFVCFFFILKLLQYCNYIIIVMQIKLMLLLLLLSVGTVVGQDMGYGLLVVIMMQGCSVLQVCELFLFCCCWFVF